MRRKVWLFVRRMQLVMLKKEEVLIIPCSLSNEGTHLNVHKLTFLLKLNLQCISYTAQALRDGLLKIFLNIWS